MGNAPLFPSSAAVAELPCAKHCAGQGGEIWGLQHPPSSTLRSTLGERTHIEIRKQREKKSESQCHGMAKSLGSEVPDNYIQISVTAGDFGEGLLTS